MLAGAIRPLNRSILLRAAGLYAERYGDADGRIPATFEIVNLAGWAPHESQPKPLPRGSAKTRLADALGVVEQKPGALGPQPPIASRARAMAALNTPVEVLPKAVSAVRITTDHQGDDQAVFDRGGSAFVVDQAGEQRAHRPSP